jgi:hypothetical protein
MICNKHVGWLVLLAGAAAIKVPNLPLNAASKSFGERLELFLFLQALA